MPALVERICAACPGIVVLDQAYLELGGEDFSPLDRRHENLVVTRTFSKGFALGAARVGYGLAQPAAGRGARRAAAAGLDLVVVGGGGRAGLRRDRRAARRAARAIVEERGWLAAGMRRAGVEVLAHAGNFVLAALAGARRLRPPRRARAAWCARSGTSRCWPIASASRSRTARPTRGSCARSPSSRAARRPTTTTACAASARPRCAAPRARRASTCGSASLGGGRARVATGLGFLDHMLTSLAFWSLIDLELRCSGDLWIDEHHTVEDCAIALGEALDIALGDRAGVRRFGRRARRSTRRWPRPPSTSRAAASPRSTSRSAHRRSAACRRRSSPTSSTRSRAAGASACTSARRGDDDHHVIEAAFKALALALREAVEPDPARSGVASTKGVL